jgi:hypothetical protein
MPQPVDKVLVTLKLYTYRPLQPRELVDMVLPCMTELKISEESQQDPGYFRVSQYETALATAERKYYEHYTAFVESLIKLAQDGIAFETLKLGKSRAEREYAETVKTNRKRFIEIASTVENKKRMIKTYAELKAEAERSTHIDESESVAPHHTDSSDDVRVFNGDNSDAATIRN